MTELSNMVEYYPYKAWTTSGYLCHALAFLLTLFQPIARCKKGKRKEEKSPIGSIASELAATDKKIFFYRALLERTSSLRSKNTLRTKRTCDILFHFGQCIYSSKIHRQSPPWSTANQKAKGAKGITAFLASIFDSEIAPLYTTEYHPPSRAKLLRLVLSIHRCGRIG